jgi:phosphoglucosamine mutase
MFGTSGIRGPVGKEVTAQLALSVGRALGVDSDRVVIGRDPRESGAALLDALAAGLSESGVDVVDLGITATPTVARAVAWEDADAGVVVTASHNPSPDNGIKLWQPSGQAFDEQRRAEITQRLRTEETAFASWDEFGHRQQRTHTDTHCQQLVEAVDISGDLSVVVDVGNGAGGVTAEALDELGCRVETLNAQPDGSFPGRPSEPTAENCGSIQTLLEHGDADLGIIHDGDADRMRAVTESGAYLSGDVLLAILARDEASAGETVAVPVDTSLAVEDHLDAAGIETLRTPVGDVYVAEAARESGVSFGGEPSGAWIWPEETLCPDGPLAACTLAGLAADRPLDERAREIETYPIRRTSVEVTDNTAVMDAVGKHVESTYDSVSTLDGVRIDVSGGWFLIRASGTQPLVRITAEARTQDRADELFEDATTCLEQARNNSKT